MFGLRGSLVSSRTVDRRDLNQRRASDLPEVAVTAGGCPSIRFSWCRPIMVAPDRAALAMTASTSARIRALLAVVMVKDVELNEIDSGVCGSGSERLWT